MSCTEVLSDNDIRFLNFEYKNCNSLFVLKFVLSGYLGAGFSAKFITVSPRLMQIRLMRFHTYAVEQNFCILFIKGYVYAGKVQHSDGLCT